ncbi:IclR family transcriptional regulator, partial [Enterococcus faecium]
MTTIAFSVLRKMDIPQIVQPILEELSHQAGETVHLGTLDGNSTRFLAVSEPTTAVRVASRLGKEMPAHCTSTGKVLLAQLPREQLDRLYPDEQLSQVTPQSIRTKTELLAQLDL